MSCFTVKLSSHDKFVIAALLTGHVYTNTPFNKQIDIIVIVHNVCVRFKMPFSCTRLKCSKLKERSNVFDQVIFG